jgi:hypothetical protein
MNGLIRDENAELRIYNGDISSNRILSSKLLLEELHGHTDHEGLQRDVEFSKVRLLAVSYDCGLVCPLFIEKEFVFFCVVPCYDVCYSSSV